MVEQAQHGVAAPAAPSRSWLRESYGVFFKDVRSELRTRSALVSILLFAVTTLLVVSFTARPEGLGLTSVLDDKGLPMAGETNLRRMLLSAMLWVVLFFSALSGLTRVFVKEEEQRTVLALRLAARPAAVFYGKLLFNVALLALVAALVVPLFVILFQARVARPELLVLTVLLGVGAMAASATILGAIVARSGAGSPLFAAMAFPLLILVLVLCIRLTAIALGMNPPQGATERNLIGGLVSYLVAMVAASSMFFEQVWTA